MKHRATTKSVKSKKRLVTTLGDVISAAYEAVPGFGLGNVWISREGLVGMVSLVPSGVSPGRKPDRMLSPFRPEG